MKRFTLFFAMAVFTIMAVSSCVVYTSAKPETYVQDVKSPQIKRVLILTKGKNSGKKEPDVAPRCAELMLEGNEQIEWVIVPPDVGFTVTFKDDTPFEKKTFDNEYNLSGPIQKTSVGNDEFYEYSLEVDGHKIIDPGVLIWSRH